MIDPRVLLRSLLSIGKRKKGPGAQSIKLTAPFTADGDAPGSLLDKPSIKEVYKITPERAQSWLDQIQTQQKQVQRRYKRDGQDVNVTRVTNPDGSYYAEKATINPTNQSMRDLLGPGYSDISFGHMAGGYDANNVKAIQRMDTEAFPDWSYARFSQDYQNELQRAGKDALLARQLDDIRVGKDVTLSAADFDGKGEARMRGYRQHTGGLFSAPRGVLSAVARKIGTDRWLPHLDETRAINDEIKVPGPNQDKHGVVTFDTTKLYDRLKKMGQQERIRYIIGALGKIGPNSRRAGLRMPFGVEAWLEMESLYRDVTKDKDNPYGRSLTQDMADKLKPQINRLNLRVPGMAFR